MRDAQLMAAQQAREERLFNEWFDGQMDLLLADVGKAPGVSEADTVGPDARHKLRGILRYYAKDPHPFRACVKDNTKRFGPGRVDRVCAVIKDIIRGTTKWRGHPALDHGAPGAIAASDAPLLDDDTETLLLAIPDERLESFVGSALTRYDDVAFAAATKKAKTKKSILDNTANLDKVKAKIQSILDDVTGDSDQDLGSDPDATIRGKLQNLLDDFTGDKDRDLPEGI